MVPHHIGMPSSNFVLKPMPSSKILRRCSLRCGRFLELVRRHRRACMHCSRINARWNGHPCAERDIPCACTWIGTVGLPIALFLYSYSCGMLHHICMHCNRNHCATAHACGETDILGACTFSATQYVHNLFILWAAKTSRMCILFVDMHSCSEIMQHVAKHPATGNICANVNNMTGHERQRVSYLLTLTNMQRILYVLKCNILAAENISTLGNSIWDTVLYTFFHNHQFETKTKANTQGYKVWKHNRKYYWHNM